MFRVIKEIEDVGISILNLRDELFAILHKVVNLPPCAVREKFKKSLFFVAVELEESDEVGDVAAVMGYGACPVCGVCSGYVDARLSRDLKNAVTCLYFLENIIVVHNFLLKIFVVSVVLLLAGLGKAFLCFQRVVVELENRLYVAYYIYASVLACSPSYPVVVQNKRIKGFFCPIESAFSCLLPYQSSALLLLE